MQFFDAHCHTPELSNCCSKKVSIEHYVAAIKKYKWLEGVVITNHSFMSYFPKNISKSFEFMKDPTLFEQYEEDGNGRIMDFIGKIAQYSGENIVMGMETEMMPNGQLTLSPKITEYIDVLIGSLHWGPARELLGNRKAIWDFFFQYNDDLMKKGIDVIAHPFRWTQQYMAIIPDKAIINEFVGLLAKNGVAGEINSHFHSYHDLGFLETMLENNVKIAFSSDCHTVKEIGNFDHQFGLLRQLGLSLSDIPFWRPPNF
jgi:histidinol phosphatase-like PHP family hydrolase